MVGQDCVGSGGARGAERGKKRTIRDVHKHTLL